MKTASWFGFVLCALSAAGEVFIAQVGQKAVLDCGVTGLRHSLEWRHGNDHLFRFQIHRGISSKVSTSKEKAEISSRSNKMKETGLQISGVKEQDAGEFTCEADGSTKKHTLVVVSVWVDPRGPLQEGSNAAVHCKIDGTSQTSTVEWVRPDGSKTQSKTVSLRPAQASHTGTWTCNVTCEGKSLKAALRIDVQVPKTTPPQNSKDSKTSFPRAHDGNGSAVLLGLSWWVWVAAGLGCVAVIVLIISVIVTCKKVRRRKRRFQKMKNAQQQQRLKKYCQCECKTAAEKPQQGRRREKPSALPLQPLLKE